MRILKLFWILSLVGCGEKTESGPSNPSAAPPPSVATSQGVPPSAGPIPPLRSASMVKAQLIPLAAAGKYEIALEWEAEGVFAEEWWVQRVKPAEGARVMVRLPAQARRFTVVDVALGVDHEYRVFAHNDGTNAEIGAVALHPHPDRVFTKGEYVWKGGQYGRLFFEFGSIVWIGDEFPMDLDLLELHSDGGIIRNYYNPAAPGHAGLSSAPLRLKVGLARGDLQLITDGQGGGQGLEGAPGAPGAAGKDAFAGRWEGWSRLVEGTSGFYQRESPRPAERGSVGGDGEKGGMGCRGGDGGAITLIVDKNAGFWPRLSSEGGPGGPGGAGGKPGPGGLGGKGAAAVPGGGREWPAAAEGPSGNPGTPGKRGADGKTGRQIVKLGEVEFRRP